MEIWMFQDYGYIALPIKSATCKTTYCGQRGGKRISSYSGSSYLRPPPATAALQTISKFRIYLCSVGGDDLRGKLRVVSVKTLKLSVLV